MAGWPSASRWKRRLVRKASPSPANIRAGSSLFPLERENPGGERKVTGQVLAAQPAEQLAASRETGERHTRHSVPESDGSGAQSPLAVIVTVRPGRSTSSPANCVGLSQTVRPSGGGSTSFATRRPVRPAPRGRRQLGLSASWHRSPRPARRDATMTCLFGCGLVVGAHRRGDLGQVAKPLRRDNRRRGQTETCAVTWGRSRLARHQSLGPQIIAQVLIERGRRPRR